MGRGNSENGESLCGLRSQRGPGPLEQPGREEGGAEGLPAALGGGGEGVGMETLTSGGGMSLAGTRQRDVREIFGRSN